MASRGMAPSSSQPRVGAVTVIEPDSVDGPDVTRTTYSAANIGAPKPDAPARQLRMIDPAVMAHHHPAALGSTDLPSTLAGVSLVVAATDGVAGQAALAHHACAAGVPLVACAMYKKAALGEVALAVPAAGPTCRWSAVGAVIPADSYSPGRDYGLGGRQASETAPGPSTCLAAGVAAFGPLAGPKFPAGRPVTPLLDQRRALGLIATAAGWGSVKTVFAGMDHQQAPQSVWARVDPSAACPVRGAQPVPPRCRQAGSDIAQITSQHRQNTGKTAYPGQAVTLAEASPAAGPPPTPKPR